MPPNGPTARPTGAEPDRRSASSPIPTDPPAGGYPLVGPSDLPDPRTHAYRRDLADVALAGRVIASHFAEPLRRTLTADAPLLAAPDGGAEVLAELTPATQFRMLDNSRGWAWGYAGQDGLVGYVRSDAVQC